MNPHHDPRFHDLARRSTGPAAMVLGDARGQARLFSLGGPEAADAEVSQATAEGFRFVGIVAVVNDSIQFEGEEGTALCMAHALEAFRLAVAVCPGPVV
jgi:hypothetical protein